MTLKTPRMSSPLRIGSEIIERKGRVACGVGVHARSVVTSAHDCGLPVSKAKRDSVSTIGSRYFSRPVRLCPAVSTICQRVGVAVAGREDRQAHVLARF